MQRTPIRFEPNMGSIDIILQMDSSEVSQSLEICTVHDINPHFLSLNVPTRSVLNRANINL